MKVPFQCDLAPRNSEIHTDHLSDCTTDARSEQTLAVLSEYWLDTMACADCAQETAKWLVSCRHTIFVVLDVVRVHIPQHDSVHRDPAGEQN